MPFRVAGKVRHDTSTSKRPRETPEKRDLPDHAFMTARPALTDGAVWSAADRTVRFARDGSVRPPWSSEIRIRASCTSCGDCIAACPQAILLAGPAGTPVIEFALGACTFCQACAESCPEPVFDLVSGPWSLVATLASSCLLNAGVACRACTDACDEAALHFDHRAGAVGRVSVRDGLCTGCGACLSICPVGAVTLSEAKSRREAAS